MFKVYKAAQQSKDLYLTLEERSDRTVVLRLVDVNGKHVDQGNLLTIYDDHISMSPFVGEDLGFQLDETGSIKIE